MALAPVVLLTARDVLAAAGGDVAAAAVVVVVGAVGVGGAVVRLAADTGAELVGVARSGDVERALAVAAARVIGPDDLGTLT